MSYCLFISSSHQHVQHMTSQILLILIDFVRVFVPLFDLNLHFKDVLDRSAIMVCKVKFGAKILPAYSPLDMK